jgi:hypothetical protein
VQESAARATRKPCCTRTRSSAHEASHSRPTGTPTSRSRFITRFVCASSASRTLAASDRKETSRSFCSFFTLKKEQPKHRSFGFDPKKQKEQKNERKKKKRKKKNKRTKETKENKKEKRKKGPERKKKRKKEKKKRDAKEKRKKEEGSGAQKKKRGLERRKGKEKKK